MIKSVLFMFIVILTAFLSGCILSKTPTTDSLTIPLGDPITYSVNVFPSATYEWTLDGAPLTNPGNFYLYTATAGDHVLTVKATHFLGTDTQTWNIQTPSPSVAEAGPDQTVAVDTTGTLDGSGSMDPDNDIVSYMWQQIDGPTVT